MSYFSPFDRVSHIIHLYQMLNIYPFNKLLVHVLSVPNLCSRFSKTYFIFILYITMTFSSRFAKQFFYVLCFSSECTKYIVIAFALYDLRCRGACALF